MERLQSLVADRQPPVAGQPGACPLDHPAVPHQPLLVLDAPARDTVDEGPLPRGRPARRGVIPLVRVQLRRASITPPPQTADQRDRLEQRREHRTVVPVGPGQPRRERVASAIDQQMPLGARFAASRRVRADRDALLYLG